MEIKEAICLVNITNISTLSDLYNFWLALVSVVSQGLVKRGAYFPFF